MKKIVTQKLIEKHPDLKDVPLGTKVDFPSAKRGVNCNKNEPSDPHYNQAGYYTDKCVWVPSV